MDKKYDNLTEELLENIITDIFDNRLEPERKLKVMSSKQGYIDYRVALLEKVNNKANIDEFRTKLENELQEGIYEW